MANSFITALGINARVIFALSLREMKGRHGRSRLGYLWQFLKTGLGIGVFIIIRGAMGAGGGHAALPFPIMLVLGFIPWFIFDGTLTKTVEAVATNNALLTFPQVKPLDLFFSSALVTWFTEIIILFFYLSLFYILGYRIHLYAPMIFFGALLGLCLFSFGLGLVLGAINAYFPVVEKLLPAIMRVLFLTSGVFFSPMQLGSHYSRYLFMNPVTNFIETMRHAFVYPELSHYINLDIILWPTFILLALGLLLERHARIKQGSI